MVFFKQRRVLLTFLAASLFSSQNVCAEKLEAMLPAFLAEHEQLQSSRANVEKARQAWMQSKADLRPSLDVTLSQGYEKQLKPTGSDTKTHRNTEQLDLTQLIYDWGGTPARVRTSELRYYQAMLQDQLTEQGLILKAAQSYLNLLRSVEALRYSQRSEANIKKQTGLEEARVKRGSGLSTDVLQTKSSLAGAMATRVRNEGSVVSSLNRFRATFRRSIPLDTLETPRVPFEKIPSTLADAIEVAKQNSLNLKQSKLDVAVAALAVRQAASKIGPKLEFKASAKHKHNDGGTLGTKEEYLAKVDLKMPLYAGGKNISGYRSAKEALAAAEFTLRDAEYNIEERVRNAWQNLSTSRSNAQFLRNQANISGEFLDFARKERKLGTRSLLDVLNGETAYINALSSAVSAETDMAIAVFTLLQAMGELTPDVFALQVVPNADSDEEIINPIIAPTPEATNAAAAARKIASKLEAQRDEHFPSAVLEKEDDDLLVAPLEEEPAEPVAPVEKTVAPVDERPASITKPGKAVEDVLSKKLPQAVEAVAEKAVSAAEMVESSAQNAVAKASAPVPEAAPAVAEVSPTASKLEPLLSAEEAFSRPASVSQPSLALEELLNEPMPQTELLSEGLVESASEVVSQSTVAKEGKAVASVKEALAQPMKAAIEPLLSAEEAFTRPASVSEPGAVLDELLADLAPAPKGPTVEQVQKIYEQFAREIEELEFEAALQEHPASISDLNWLEQSPDA